MILTTERLVLRPPDLADAPAIQQLAGAREVALNTLLIPHPYPEGAAEAWLGRPRSENDNVFILTLRGSGEIVGVMGLHVDPDHKRAEIGYWIGVPYWNRGYATEAARAVVRFAFEELGLNRVFAEVFARNPASARVLQKVGMRHEGTPRRHVVKWGEAIDVEMYGMLREELS
jgi:RimJ/RimL family protein N-acetyltransferase